MITLDESIIKNVPDKEYEELYYKLENKIKEDLQNNTNFVYDLYNEYIYDTNSYEDKEFVDYDTFVEYLESGGIEWLLTVICSGQFILDDINFSQDDVKNCYFKDSFKYDGWHPVQYTKKSMLYTILYDEDGFYEWLYKNNIEL